MIEKVTQIKDENQIDNTRFEFEEEYGVGELNQHLINAKREYADTWENDAKYYYNNNFYMWMETGIKEKKAVLEIGCGVGYSTLQLLQLGHQVISVDYNMECLLRTKRLLEKYK